MRVDLVAIDLMKIDLVRIALVRIDLVTLTPLEVISQDPDVNSYMHTVP